MIAGGEVNMYMTDESEKMNAFVCRYTHYSICNEILQTGLQSRRLFELPGVATF